MSGRTDTSNAGKRSLRSLRSWSWPSPPSLRPGPATRPPGATAPSRSYTGKRPGIASRPTPPPPLGGQQLAADSAMFNGWLQARAANDPQLEAVFVRRFTPDYRGAFAAWLKTDPFTNPAAPAGPGYMPQYRNPQLEEAKRLNAQATTTFEEGTAARETADRYVRATVLFALVLFLVAVGQRFRIRGVRIAANTVALAL